MSLRISLLGAPHITRDGQVEQPRGNKAWGLLAYLVRMTIPAPREQLAGLLFPNAHDPLAALRWSLTELRRVLGGRAVVAGDPLRLVVGLVMFVDVDVLTSGSWVEVTQLPGLGVYLLGGVMLAKSRALQLRVNRCSGCTCVQPLRRSAGRRVHSPAPRGTSRTGAAYYVVAAGSGSTASTRTTRRSSFESLSLTCATAAADVKAGACVESFRTRLGVEVVPGPLPAGAA